MLYLPSEPLQSYELFGVISYFHILNTHYTLPLDFCFRIDQLENRHVRPYYHHNFHLFFSCCITDVAKVVLPHLPHLDL